MPDNNKIALVSGASRGIGKSISTALVSSEAEVILSARNIEKLEAVKRRHPEMPPFKDYK